MILKYVTLEVIYLNQNIPKTRLELLMKLTGVTGKAIAGSLHVDMSLVSRWKNGKRSLKYNVEQLEKICDFFLSSHNGTYYNIIKKIAISENQDKCVTEDGISNNDIKRNLSRWLLQEMSFDDYIAFEHNKTDGADEADDIFYLSFKGNLGRRQSVMAFLEKLLSLKQSQHILILNQEDSDWLREDKAFFNEWQSMMIKILNLGHHITLILGNYGKSNELLFEIFEWMPLYLTGRVSTYVEPYNKRLDISQSFYLADNLFSLNGYNIKNNSNRFTAFTNDKLTVQSQRMLIEQFMSECKEMIKVYDQSNIEKIADTIIKIGENNDNSYFMSDELFFTNMTYDLLNEILNYNNCTANEKKRALGFYQQLNQNFGQNITVFENHHIYNYKSLERCIKQESYQNHHLSIVTGCPIVITRKHFIQHIEQTINRLYENDSFKIALIFDEQKPAFLKNVDFWVKDGYFLCAWSHENYEHMIMSTDLSLTHLFTEYYQGLWRNITIIEKDKKSVVKRLNKLLKIAGGI